MIDHDQPAIDHDSPSPTVASSERHGPSDWGSVDDAKAWVKFQVGAW